MRDPELDVDATIGAMSDAHLHCRDYGHSWRPHTAIFVASQRVYEQALRCQRCRTMRRRLLDSHGAVIRSDYDYADGYLVKGLGRLTGDDRGLVRLASVQADIGRTDGKSNA